jgi:hypothetical protein
MPARAPAYDKQKRWCPLMTSAMRHLFACDRALERTLGNMRAEKDSAITSGGRTSSNGGSLGGWLTSLAVDSPDSKCPRCFIALAVCVCMYVCVCMCVSVRMCTYVCVVCFQTNQVAPDTRMEASKGSVVRRSDMIDAWQLLSI